MSATPECRLINTVRENPSLYNTATADYHNAERKKYLWTQLAEKSGGDWKDGEEMSAKWANIRDTYIRKRRQVRTLPSGASRDQMDRITSWVFYKELAFLDDVPTQRATRTSMPPPVKKSKEDLNEDPPAGGSGSGISETKEVIDLTEGKPVLAPKHGTPTSNARKAKLDELMLDALQTMKRPPPPSECAITGQKIAKGLEDLEAKHGEVVRLSVEQELLTLLTNRRVYYSHHRAAPANSQLDVFSSQYPQSASAPVTFIDSGSSTSLPPMPSFSSIHNAYEFGDYSPRTDDGNVSTDHNGDTIRHI